MGNAESSPFEERSYDARSVLHKPTSLTFARDEWEQENDDPTNYSVEYPPRSRTSVTRDGETDESQIDTDTSDSSGGSGQDESLTEASGDGLNGLSENRNDEDESHADRSAAVFAYLDKEDVHSIANESAAVFGFLEEENNDNERIDAPDPPTINIGDLKKQKSRPSKVTLNTINEAMSADAKSISEYSAQVFKFLDDEAEVPTENRLSALLEATASPRSLMALSPKSNPTVQHRNHKLPLQVVKEPDDMSTATSAVTDNDRDDVSIESDYEEEESNIDLIFVEQFDSAFNEFLGRNPQFSKNAALMDQIRIAKLQKLLEHLDTAEREALNELTKLKEDKKHTESDLSNDLRFATCRKAARQTFLQSELAKMNAAAKQEEVKLTWDIVAASELRCKRQQKMIQQAKNRDFDDSRDGAIHLIPHDKEGVALREAILASSGYRTNITIEEKVQLLQYQVDNAFKKSELEVLKKKLAYQHMNAKEYSWVESILLKMDKRSMSKLKGKYLKSVGVQKI